VVLANANPESCKALAEALEGWGLQVLVAHDGVEAILTIQRALPRAIVLDAALPKMFGFQVCELVKRNESLRSTHVVLVGAIYKEDRYRRPPNDLYGADVYVEPHDLPDALRPIFERFGFRFGGGPAPVPEARSLPPVADARPQRPPQAPEARAPRGDAERSASVRATAPQAPPAAADPLAAERAKAERLARIIVSDIVLYNPEKFAAALRSASVVDAMRDELEEARGLFRERIDAAVRDERDHLAEELERVARTRGAR
jgi:CheY-like chemotaxis protein